MVLSRFDLPNRHHIFTPFYYYYTYYYYSRNLLNLKALVLSTSDSYVNITIFYSFHFFTGPQVPSLSYLTNKFNKFLLSKRIRNTLYEPLNNLLLRSGVIQQLFFFFFLFRRLEYIYIALRVCFYCPYIPFIALHPSDRTTTSFLHSDFRPSSRA